MNILTTIPRSKFRTWADCRRSLQRCTGEPNAEGECWYWRINTHRKPQKDLTGAVCFLVYAGRVRGYLHLIDIAPKGDWDWNNAEEKRAAYEIVMAVFRPFDGPEMTGFQGWRYTQLRP